MHAESFDLFEQQQSDAFALQVAEASFAGVPVVPERSKSKAGAETGNEEEGEVLRAPVQVEFTERNLTRYEDPESAPETRITVEEFLRLNSKESKSSRAFKTAMNELLTRCNQSQVSALSCGSLPSTEDYIADVLLGGKRTLSQSLYQVFCWAVRTEFVRWHQVPEVIQRTIMERVGANLLERGIIRGGKTSAYFFNGWKARGPRTPDTRSVRIV